MPPAPLNLPAADLFAAQDSALHSDDSQEWIRACQERIRQAFGHDLPEIALVLGSGFQAVPANFKVQQVLSYNELPGFPCPNVKGHPGRLLLVEISGMPLLVCCGRAHFYEGHSMPAIMFPIRVLKQCGVHQLLLTNAAGGINRKYRPGDFMLFSDHINFTGVNPLRGLPIEDGRCFVDLSQCYSRALGLDLLRAARKAHVTLHEGVYVGVSGPSYETPAEIRAFARVGADAVGMSTIPEVLMAKYEDMEVAAISCITNPAAGLSRRKLSHDEVLAVGRRSAEAATRLFEFFAVERQNAAARKQKAHRSPRKNLRINRQQLPCAAKVA